jgi:hypothetical protein
LLKLADTVLILINPSPSNVKLLTTGPGVPGYNSFDQHGPRFNKVFFSKSLSCSSNNCVFGMAIRVVEFSSGGTKLERFLHKNQHTQKLRKIWMIFDIEN